MKDFESQLEHQIVDYSLVHEARSITNFGIGYEFDINEGVSLYSSFTTDFSTIVPNSNNNHSVARWNIYHLIGGSTLEFSRTQLTLGLEYAFGSQTGMKLFEDVESKIPLISDINKNAELSYDRLKLILVLQVKL